MENSATDLQPLEQFSSDSAIQPQVTWQLNALQEASGLGRHRDKSILYLNLDRTLPC
ncbi:hypothetical protein CsatA_023043 [Cannabis sativa]